MTADEVRRRAPKCTQFAGELREIFGEAKIERVEEGDLQKGKSDQNVYATCFYSGSGTPILQGK